MCIKSKKNYCDGCEFFCRLDATRKVFPLFPAKYYPTINGKKVKTYINIDGDERPTDTKTKLHAIARANMIAKNCVRNYQNQK